MTAYHHRFARPHLRPPARGAFDCGWRELLEDDYGTLVLLFCGCRARMYRNGAQRLIILGGCPDWHAFDLARTFNVGLEP